ncbi:hypothetical protein [Nonomuraea sp. NPDC046570]|uniref:hypothetical protein n=1 Tax=Nonomuraea sp. NPDC046570 TaxID=3155255 RepID=UPI0033FDA727
MTHPHSAPPVPPSSYWPDRGGQAPTSSKPPGWAMAIMAGTATVLLLGGGLIAVRNLGGPPASPPVALPTYDLPTSDKPPAQEPTEPAPTERPEETATPGPSSTFVPLTSVPEVCDLLSEALVKRLVPGGASEPGVAKDGYGALRKDCEWRQQGYHMKNGYNEQRSIGVKVNVFPNVAEARDSYDFSYGSMKDMGGTKQENPGLKYLSTYGQVKDFTGIGDEAHAMYTSNLKGTTNVWLFLIMGNTTVDLRYRGTDNKGREILAEGDDTRPVAEDVLMKGAEEVAEEVVAALAQ